MPNELTINHLLPALNNTTLVGDKLRNSTFIGIDFGTSTTVVSYAVIGNNNSPVKTDVMPLRQLNMDGSFTVNHLVPSVIAWHDNKLFIGQTARQLKSKLTYGRNLWYSFKMKIGTDNGPVYFATELPKGHQVASIENPLDAAKVFFHYLKSEINHFISTNKLPAQSFYSISIPASFEANQRKDLMEALEFAGIPFQDTLFIDEPNSAFLSYLVEANSNNLSSYNIPVDSPLHILVFDFGAGTCDISILEIGRKAGRLYSKNVAISKFEQLGGDDIDKKIVKDILFKQLLQQNKLEADEIKTPEYNKIILPKLQPIAEALKIRVCKAVAQNLVGKELPSISSSENRLAIDQKFQITLPKHVLEYTSPSLSFAEFKTIMDKFNNEQSLHDYTDDLETLKSIFTVINSALTKGNLSKDEVDLVLLIGGSSYNPYTQPALRHFFSQSEIEIPGDLQSHVSTGTAVNSFLQNGMNIDIIKPIVSEPVLVILENNTSMIIVHEGTEIPCKGITVEDLHPQREGQKVIEIPICVSNKDKILANVKIQSEAGFAKSTPITLLCDISHDKLIYFRAFVEEQEVQVEPLNPFANAALSTEEIAEKKLLKVLNEAARAHGGKPPVKLLHDLAAFYVKLEKHLKAAETFETIQQLDPNSRYETSICFHYSMAGKKKQSDKWAEIAYNKSKIGTNAYNLALVRESDGNIVEYERLMEEAISLNSDAALLTFGEYLLTRDKERSKQFIEKAFDKYYAQFKSNSLTKNDYSRLIRAARQLGRIEIAEEAKQKQQQFSSGNEIRWYNEENLASGSKISLPKIEQ